MRLFGKRDILGGSRLRQVPIGVRLRLVFALIVSLMFVGSSFALWYLRSIRLHLARVSLVEQRMSAVLRIDNGILTLMSQLRRSGDLRNRDRFQADAARLLSDFRFNVAGAAAVLGGIAPENNRQAVILESLKGLLEALPDRVMGLVDLARADDWTAMHARLLNQVDRTDDVVAALVSEINRDLVQSRIRLRDEVSQAEFRTAVTLGGTGLLSLLLAALLGIVVTRSITRPLASLDAGARALAHGEFGAKLAVAGSDELSELARVFNQTARELEELYGKLRLSEARFRSLIENASEVILIVNEAGLILYASPSTARVLGRPAEHFAGQQIRDLLPGEEIPRADQIFRDVRQTGGTQSFDLRMRHRDGSFHAMEGLAANLLNDPSVAGIVINARDVSDRRRAEKILREREDQLRQAQKMEAIGRLAGGVAHDFNNLLTVINGYSELLMEALDSQDARRNYARDIHDAGLQAADLTRQLLAFSRKQMLRPALLSLDDVVRDTERMLRRVIGEDIELVCRLESFPGAVEADRNQLRQVLLNLAVNARDAMPRGGRLTIETGSADLPVPLVVHGDALPPGSYMTLVVADTGEGMDDATQRQVFEPFFTTKMQGKGTGLGLSTVYGIISQSGGAISVQSHPGRGTTFHIYLPRASRGLEAAELPKVAQSVQGSETILVVEDQPEVRRFACDVLQSYGYRVLEAGDADEALRVSAAFPEPIDVLLTDVVMPGMNGVELSRQLLSLRPDVKVIFASGYADSVMLRHGVLDTGTVLIPKPYAPVALAAKIREVIDS